MQQKHPEVTQQMSAETMTDIENLFLGEVTGFVSGIFPNAQTKDLRLQIRNRLRENQMVYGDNRSLEQLNELYLELKIVFEQFEDVSDKFRTQENYELILMMAGFLVEWFAAFFILLATTPVSSMQLSIALMGGMGASMTVPIAGLLTKPPFHRRFKSLQGEKRDQASRILETFVHPAIR